MKSKGQKGRSLYFTITLRLFDDRCQDSNQFVAFLNQRGQAVFRRKARCRKKAQPVSGFAGFLPGDGVFRDEIRPGFAHPALLQHWPRWRFPSESTGVRGTVPRHRHAPGVGIHGRFPPQSERFFRKCRVACPWFRPLPFALRSFSYPPVFQPLTRPVSCFPCRISGFQSLVSCLQRHIAGLHRLSAGLQRHDADFPRHDAGLQCRIVDLERHGASLQCHDAGLHCRNVSLQCDDVNYLLRPSCLLFSFESRFSATAALISKYTANALDHSRGRARRAIPRRVHPIVGQSPFPATVLPMHLQAHRSGVCAR